MEFSDLKVGNKGKNFQWIHLCPLYLQLNGEIDFHVA